VKRVGVMNSSINGDIMPVKLYGSILNLLNLIICLELNWNLIYYSSRPKFVV